MKNILSKKNIYEKYNMRT